MFPIIRIIFFIVAVRMFEYNWLESDKIYFKNLVIIQVTIFQTLTIRIFVE